MIGRGPEAILAAACTLARDPVRIARVASTSQNAVRAYMRRHGLEEDHRSPHERIVDEHGASRNCADRLLGAAQQMYALTHSAHATYAFVWNVGRESWNHDRLEHACVMDLGTYHRLVARATVQMARRWHHVLVDRDVLAEGIVVVRRMTIERGWGRGPYSVPWQLLAHPANLLLVPRDEAYLDHHADPNTLLRDVEHWNDRHGPALIDATACCNLPAIMQPSAQNAN